MQYSAVCTTTHSTLAALACRSVQVAEHHLVIVAGEENVARLDVAMDDAVVVKILQAQCKVPRQASTKVKVVACKATRPHGHVKTLPPSLHDEDVRELRPVAGRRGKILVLSWIFGEQRLAGRQVPPEDGNDALEPVLVLLRVDQAMASG